MTRDLAAAQHEAAHVVVGVSCGMRLREAVVYPRRRDGLYAYTGFDQRTGTVEACALMLAAGVAWERHVTGNDEGAAGDLALLRKMGVRDERPLVRAAWSMLRDRSRAHGRITRALVDRDLRGSDLAAFVRGEWRRARFDDAF